MLARAGVHACPRRVAAAYLELAVLVRALQGLSDAARLEAAARRVLAVGRPLRPARQPARLDGRRPAGPCRLALAGVARARASPSSGRSTSTSSPGRAAAAAGGDGHGAAFARVPGGKGANQAVASARLGADVRSSARSATTSSRTRRCREEERLDVDAVRVAAPTGVAMISSTRAARTRSSSRRGRTRRCAPRARRERRGALPARDPDEAVVAAAEQARVFCLNAAPARPIDVERRPDRRQPLELEVARAPRRARCGDARRRGRAAARGRGGGRARRAAERRRRRRHRRRRRVHRLPARLAPRGPRHEEALRRACAAGAIAASRSGAQPSLPTAAEVDAILDP